MNHNYLLFGICFGVSIGVAYYIDHQGEDAPTTVVDIVKNYNYIHLSYDRYNESTDSLSTDEEFRNKLNELVSPGDPALSYPISQLLIEWLRMNPSEALGYLASLDGYGDSLEYEEIIQECGRVHKELVTSYWEKNAEKLGSAFAEGIARIYQAEEPMKAFEVRFWAARLPENTGELFRRLFADYDNPKGIVEMVAQEKSLNEAATRALYRGIGYTFGTDVPVPDLTPALEKHIAWGALERIRVEKGQFFSEVHLLATKEGGSNHLETSVEMMWELGYDTLRKNIDAIKDDDLQGRVIHLAFGKSLKQDNQAYPIELWEMHKKVTGRPPMDPHELENFATDNPDILFPILAMDSPERLMNRYEAMDYGDRSPRRLAGALVDLWNRKSAIGNELDLKLGIVTALHDGPIEELLSRLPPDVTVPSIGKSVSFDRSGVIGDLSRTDPVESIKLAIEIADPLSRNIAFNIITGNAVSIVPIEIKNAIDAFPNSTHKDDAITMFASYLGMQNPTEGSRILAEMHAAGPLPDKAVQAFVHDAAKFDIEGALGWLDVIKDQDLRAETWKDLEGQGLIADDI